jgi:hypothetical protein
MAGVRQSTIPVSGATNITGFLLFFVPPTLSLGVPALQSLHTLDPLSLSVNLIDRGNWLQQMEQPKLSSVVLLFTIGVALISLFSLMSELTALVHAVVHWVSLARRHKFPIVTAMRKAGEHDAHTDAGLPMVNREPLLPFAGSKPPPDAYREMTSDH